MGAEIISDAGTNTYAQGVSRAAEALRSGALVIFPTETVYGVAANAADPQAVARLRAVKGRDDGRPFTVHVAGRRDARNYVGAPSPLLRRLIRKAWPGPVTFVCEVAQPESTPIAQALPREQLKEVFYEGTVGLRCPAHAGAELLLRDAGVPIVASSANRAGQPPPFDLQAALRDLGEQVEIAIDGGRTSLSAASTIVEVRGNAWRVLRAGAIDERTIERLARSEVLFVCTGNTCRSPMAEYMFRRKLADRLGCRVEQLAAAGYHVSSAGTMPLLGGPAASGTIDELAQRGIDGRAHSSQPLTIELLQRAEKVYAMTPDHIDAVRHMLASSGSRVELLDPAGSIADPIGGGPEEYRRASEHIERAVEARLEEFLNEDRDW